MSRRLFCALHTLSHFTLTTTLLGRYYFCSNSLGSQEQEGHVSGQAHLASQQQGWAHRESGTGHSLQHTLSCPVSTSSGF